MLTDVVYRCLHCSHRRRQLWPLISLFGRIRRPVNSDNLVTNRFVHRSTDCFNVKPSDGQSSAGHKPEVSDEQPIKYTSSDAHLKHKAYMNFRLSDEEMNDILWYERPILMISAVIFLIYFAYLREPNDIDEKMGRPLFEVMPQLEVPMIESAIGNAERMGADTKQLMKRLDELKELRQQIDKLDKQSTK
ncbi:uncharacterized protein LOC128951824 [Oppia nitens]|uniref:uncharacterized protein LOC128951824 n=1 Tax=Oppia nitens TaxID=1686743 RepID=UPI0023DB8A8F|nr:uncharacterized protein LOC128951824 [Oppia nitens]